MAYTATPLRISCQSVLSTGESPWGAEDGIRFYCLLTTSGGFRELLVSGRQFPPPDVVDNFVFRPGVTLDLSSYPPKLPHQHDWRSRDIVLGSSEFLSIVLIGINEGLPYIGGGGGFGSVGTSAFLEAQKSLSGKLADTAVKIGEAGIGGVLTDAVFEALKTLLEDLNRFPDCRGVAFANSVVLDRKTLFYKTLHDPIFQLQPEIDEVGIATTLLIKQGCGTPSYRLPVSIARTFARQLSATSSVQGTRQIGDTITSRAKITVCDPGRPLQTWLLSQDNEVEVTPSVWYGECSPTWTVNGVPVTQESGELSVSVDAQYFAGSGSSFTQQQSQRQIMLSYTQQQDADGSGRLILNTNGGDGNYVLTIGLLFNFEGTYDRDRSIGVIEIASTKTLIQGQVWASNEAQQQYESCLRTTWSNLGKQLTQFAPSLGPLPPGPLDIAAVEEQLNALSKVIRQTLPG